MDYKAAIKKIRSPGSTNEEVMAFFAKAFSAFDNKEITARELEEFASSVTFHLLRARNADKSSQCPCGNHDYGPAKDFVLPDGTKVDGNTTFETYKKLLDKYHVEPFVEYNKIAAHAKWTYLETDIEKLYLLDAKEYLFKWKK